MAWEKLAGRLNKLPLLLAGPILRQVTPTSVTVWVALLRPADVTLTIYASGTPVPRKLTAATRKTTAIGTNLHITAVTATFITETLSPGNLYLYDLSFLDQGVAIVSLPEALRPPPEGPMEPPPGKNPLAYATIPLPSFSLPPADPNKLRLFHGSCRKPQGEEEDALAILDDLIASTAEKPNERPHQLLLTGDQIYADDVADSLLLLLTDAGETLLGWNETLPVFPPHGVPSKPQNLPPYARARIFAGVGFPSEDFHTHLMSLGEYLSMYLFAWSDALWPRSSAHSEGMDTLPTFIDIVASVRGQADKDKLIAKIADREKKIELQRTRLRHFRDRLSKIRKALANIPTYMICDDHEVTDDWNMTRHFCENVYGTALGVRVVQNALVAFAICQAWGNRPDLFDPKIQVPTPPFKPAGARLLELFANYEQNSDEIRQIVGVHTAAELERAPGIYRVFHEAASLRYDFKIDGPGHVIIVTDTRTWRSFPKKGRMTPPDLFGPGELANQLTLSATDKPKLVVLTTNAPMLRADRLVAAYPFFGEGYENELYESWQFPSLAFDQMVVQLSKMCPPVSGTLTGQIILLSGDYHYAFATRLDYWATTRLGEAPQPTKLVIAQLVSSPLRNEKDSTRGHQKDGYTYHQHWYEGLLMPRHEPEGYAGWNRIGFSGDFVVGTRNKPGPFGGGVSHVARVWVDSDEPTLKYELSGADWIIQLTKVPDYRYRLEYLHTLDTDRNAPTPPPIGPVAGESPRDRMDATKKNAVAAGALRALHNSKGVPPEIVGVNNIGEINFQWDLNPRKDRRVFQTLYCQDDKGVMWARYDVSLNIDDPKYPPIKARDGEP